MKKVYLFLFISCFFCMSSLGEEILLHEVTGSGSINQGGEKGSTETVRAFLQSSVLTISFSSAVTSQVVVKDRQTNAFVYSDSFVAATEQVINLTTLPAGEYELSVYVYGEWWEGVFELE